MYPIARIFFFFFRKNIALTAASREWVTYTHLISYLTEVNKNHTYTYRS